MLELNAKLRPTKSKNNQIRTQGYVPAILYGPKTKNISLTINDLALNKIYQAAGESTLLKLKIKEADKKADQEKMVLIHDLAKDPVSDKIIHVDFYQPKLDEKITAEVPLEFVGQSPAAVTLGGILIKNIHQLEVEALPQNLPRVIEVDISSLKTFDDIIHIKDLKLPEGVKVSAETDEAVVNVLPPRTEAEMEELEQVSEEKPEEVKIEGEEKQKVETEETTEESKEETKPSDSEEKKT